MNKRKILYVDDEEVNLKVFLGTFRRDYQIFTATSGKEGLDILHRQPVELVISDQRMPQMTGVEFLRQVRLNFSHIKLILLTGFSDIQAIIEAINECKIYNYISKPWIESDLRLKISNALESYELQHQNQQLIRDLQTVNLRLEEYTHSLEEKVEERTQQIKEQNIALWKKNHEIEIKNYELIKAQTYIKNVNEQLIQANNSLEDKVQERTRKLYQLNLELQKANEELDLFIYRASHDLRGPIASIQGLVQLAQMESEDISQYLNGIQATSQRMDNTIHKLKYINAINHALTKYESVNLYQLIDNIYKFYTKKITEFEIEFLNEIDPHITLNLNEELLHIIFENLIENAIYFRNPQSSIKPFVRLIAQKNEQELQILVIDNGIGIANEYHSKIFQMFFRASEASKGNGLGLYIVKKAVEKLNINILLNSQSQQGSIFTLVFKLS